MAKFDVSLIFGDVLRKYSCYRELPWSYAYKLESFQFYLFELCGAFLNDESLWNYIDHFDSGVLA